jgi:outer membrane protein assembly factor BamB
MFRAVCLITLSLSTIAVAADWPQWRGPNRDGKSEETGLLAQWPAGGPRLVWKAQGLGEGYSSIAVVGNRLYTQGQKGDGEFVLALDAATGKEIWKTPTGHAWGNDKGNGPRGMPTVDGSRLYAESGDGVVVCLETATGKKVWGTNLLTDFKGKTPHWGYSESPLVDGEKVIVAPGGAGASVVALNKATGAVIWKSQSDGAGYSSAIPFDSGPTHGLAILTANAAVGLNLKNGELLWRYPNVANHTANIATPIVKQDHIFFSSAYNTGCALLKLTPQGGSVDASEVYFSKDMQNHYTTSVLVGDYVYGSSNAIFTAMEFLTGKVVWRDRGVGKGNCIYADQRLYCLGETGTVGLIEPTPKAYTEKSRFEIQKGDNPTWTPPVVANGRLYLREQDNLYSYDIKR